MARDRMNKIPVEFSDGQALSASKLNELQIALMEYVQGHTHVGTDAGQQLQSGAIAPGAINDTHLAQNAVRKAHITTGAVGRSELAYATVQEQHLDDAAVTTNKLRDGNVTEPKLAPAVQAKLNAPRDGASAYAHCTWVDGMTRYGHGDQNYWYAWVWDAAYYRPIKSLELERRWADGVWHACENLGLPLTGPITRAHLLTPVSGFFGYRALLTTVGLTEVVAPYEWGHWQLKLANSQTLNQADEELIRYLERTGYASYELIARIRTRTALWSHRYSVAQAMAGTRADGFTYSDIAWIDGQFRVTWTKQGAPSATEYLKPRDAARFMNEVFGFVPTDLQTLIRDGIKYQDQISQAKLAADVKAQFGSQWPYAGVPVTKVELTADAPPKWRLTHSGGVTPTVLTDQELTDAMYKHSGSIDTDIISEVLYSLSATGEWQPTVLVPATPLNQLPGPLTDRMQVRWLADLWQYGYGEPYNNKVQLYPGVPHNGAFADDGLPVAFQVNQTLTTAQRLQIQRMLGHFGIDPVGPVERLVKHPHSVAFLNNPALFVAGYWTGGSRNVKGVVHFAKDGSPYNRPSVRVWFERPYRDTAYSVTVTPDTAGYSAESPVPAVLRRTRQYVDLAFYQGDLALANVNFTIVVHGELEYA